MISLLEIHGFKRFANAEFRMKPLTVLAGANGMGKSTVVQSLVLQNQAKNSRNGFVSLNMPEINFELGTFSDILNFETAGGFRLAVTSSIGREAFEFVGKAEDSYARVSGDAPVAPVNEPARSFQYLCAERHGPRIYQQASGRPVAALDVGCRGQYVAELIDGLASEIVSASRLGGDAQLYSVLIKGQTEAWLSRVTRHVQLDTDNYPSLGLFGIRFRTGEEWVKPTNMGFGISFALPVVLAGLSAAATSFLIVENPEAHLHPDGQSQMGVFLATMAASGVQVLVETHSDHVINGVRRSISELGILPDGDCIIHYFGGAEEALAESIFVGPQGGLSHWPAGFFDRYQKDISALSRVRRRKT